MTAAGNAANVASRKRKSNGHQVSSSSKRVALELFPTHPKQKELSYVSQSPALNHDANGGQNQILSAPQNIQSFTSLLNSGHYYTNVQSGPLEAQEDPLERLFKNQVCLYVSISVFVL